MSSIIIAHGVSMKFVDLSQVLPRVLLVLFLISSLYILWVSRNKYNK
jgi:hypothetical protein